MSNEIAELGMCLVGIFFTRHNHSKHHKIRPHILSKKLYISSTKTRWTEERNWLN